MNTEVCRSAESGASDGIGSRTRSRHSMSLPACIFAGILLRACWTGQRPPWSPNIRCSKVAITSDADGTNPAFVPSSCACPVRRVRGDALEWEHQIDDHELALSVDLGAAVHWSASSTSY